jgi:hypothetical protein
MNKQSLEHFLLKASEGDISFKQKVLERITDRLVILPTQKDNGDTRPEFTQAELRSDDDRIVKLRVFRYRVDGRSIIPIFTSDKHFKVWCERENIDCNIEKIFGGDVALALQGRAFIQVNPLQGSSILISPQESEKMAGVTFAPQKEEKEIRTRSKRMVDVGDKGLVSSDLFDHFEASSKN